MTGRALLKQAEVCRRLGEISNVTLWRMLNDPAYAYLKFQQPIKRGRLNYWFADQIDDVLDRLEAHQSEEKHSSPPRPRVGKKAVRS